MSDSPWFLRFLRGDATSPRTFGPKIIAHVCNDRGGRGKGFVPALSRRRPEPEQEHRSWHHGRAGDDFGLGAVRPVPVSPDVRVADVVAQHGVRRGSGGPPIRYRASDTCPSRLAEHALEPATTVHMPHSGCGRAGEHWERVQPLVEERLSSQGVHVTVYDTD